MEDTSSIIKTKTRLSRKNKKKNKSDSSIRMIKMNGDISSTTQSSSSSSITSLMSISESIELTITPPSKPRLRDSLNKLDLQQTTLNKQEEQIGFQSGSDRQEREIKRKSSSSSSNRKNSSRNRSSSSSIISNESPRMKVSPRKIRNNNIKRYKDGILNEFTNEFDRNDIVSCFMCDTKLESLSLYHNMIVKTGFKLDSKQCIIYIYREIFCCGSCKDIINEQQSIKGDNYIVNPLLSHRKYYIDCNLYILTDDDS